MTERRCYRHHNQQQHQSHHRQHDQSRQVFDERCRILEDELKRKNDVIESLRNEIVLSNQSADLSRSSCIPPEQSFTRQGSQRSNVSSNWNSLAKDRELAKLKALVFQKDNELIALASTHKNTILQMEERMERERKVWNDHKDLSIAGERAKYEEEKTRLFHELQEQLKIEQERSQRLEQKLYETQMQSSEAQLMLKESGRERINAVFGTKEQCRKEFQEEISRMRNQFQAEKDAEFTRVQERIRELEETLDQATNENADGNVRQHELFLNLESSEKSSVRCIHECIKKLHMAMESPSHIYATIPNVSSFTYDRESIVERLPTRGALKLLQDAVDEVRNYILEQRVQIEAKTKFLKKSKVLNDRTMDYSNRARGDGDDDKQEKTRHSLLSRNSLSKHQKENDHYFRDIDRLSQTCDSDRRRSHHRLQNPFQLSSQQNETIDNLVQKLEDHIATELDRLTKQRLTLNGTHQSDERSLSYHLEAPKKVKFEPMSDRNAREQNQNSYNRQAQDRGNDLREDSLRLRDQPQSKSSSSTSNRSTYQEDENPHSFSSMRSYDYPPK